MRESESTPLADEHALLTLLRGRRVVALTGAGCSTGSGIPDYRGPDGQTRKRPPIQYREFMNNVAMRRRYWARSTVGWPRFVRAQPNDTHRAVATLEHAGVLQGVITQNVDRLHHAAGNRKVVELHGALERVRCMDCNHREPRAALQERLLDLNPSLAHTLATPAPDGDAELDPALMEGFVFAQCLACGGEMLKPDVVFFGENVLPTVVDAAWRLFDRGEVLLVLGSSLAVFSGYRFVLRAAERGVPVAIVNRGVTRGDPHATIKVDAELATTLTTVVSKLL